MQKLIDFWSVRDGISRHLCRAVAWMESGYHPGAVSSVGAWGVMQVMPATWSWVEWRLIGHRVPKTTSGNIRIGIAYLRQLLRDFHGDVRLALASYYQGEGAVRQLGILPVSARLVADILALSRRCSPASHLRGGFRVGVRTAPVGRKCDGDRAGSSLVA